MRNLINSTKVFRVLELEDLLPEAVRHDGILLDPTKVTIDISGCGYTVEDLQKALFERFNIQVEKSTFNTLTLLLTIGTTRSCGVAPLRRADAHCARGSRAPAPCADAGDPRVHQAEIPAARRVLLRRRAHPGVRRTRAREPAPRGRIAADQIVPYPPEFRCSCRASSSPAASSSTSAGCCTPTSAWRCTASCTKATCRASACSKRSAADYSLQ